MKVVIAIDSLKPERLLPPEFIVLIRLWKLLCARLPTAVKVPFRH